jgi:hypothetical protein
VEVVTVMTHGVPGHLGRRVATPIGAAPIGAAPETITGIRLTRHHLRDQ